MTARLILFGTGDWGEWADPIFAAACAPGGAALVVAAGQVENGRDAVDSYMAGAAERLARVGLRTLDVTVLSRADADSDVVLRAAREAGLVYVLGGGPRGTVGALSGSRLWAQLRGMDAPYVGSSGGAMLVGALYPDAPDAWPFAAALSLLPRAVFAAHWNELEPIEPTLRRRFIAAAESRVLVGLDRDAGIVGDGANWEAVGPAAVTVKDEAGALTVYRSGDRFRLDLT